MATIGGRWDSILKDKNRCSTVAQSQVKRTKWMDYLICFIWNFHGRYFSILLAGSNEATEDYSLCPTTAKYNKTACTALGNTSQSHIVVCVCVHPPSAFLPVRKKCDKWPRQSLMKRWDCPARHRAIIGLRYTDSPKEKSSFNQPRLIWDKGERCLSGERKESDKAHNFYYCHSYCYYRC